MTGNNLDLKRRVRKVATLLRKAQALKNEAEELNRNLFPVGETVEWMHSEFWQTGRVISHTYGARMIVENHRTGRRRSITNFDMARVFWSWNDKDHPSWPKR